MVLMHSSSRSISSDADGLICAVFCEVRDMTTSVFIQGADRPAAAVSANKRIFPTAASQEPWFWETMTQYGRQDPGQPGSPFQCRAGRSRVLTSDGGNRGRIVFRSEDRRSGDDDVGAGFDRLPGMLAILAAVDFDERIKAARLAELAQAT